MNIELGPQISSLMGVGQSSLESVVTFLGNRSPWKIAGGKFTKQTQPRRDILSEIETIVFQTESEQMKLIHSSWIGLHQSILHASIRNKTSSQMQPGDIDDLFE